MHHLVCFLCVLNYMLLCHTTRLLHVYKQLRCKQSSAPFYPQ